MRLVDVLDRETAAFHGDLDEEVRRLGSTASDYRSFLVKEYGFVAPVERSISTTTDVERFVDLRRFQKQELLRRDLIALHMSSSNITSLAQCSVPLFNTAAEALGWAYCLERSTLAHRVLFMHFASTIPGDVAFASSYLKCYAGSIGEMWRGFGDTLDVVQREQAQQVVDAAVTAFRFYRRWHAPEEHAQPAPPTTEPTEPTTDPTPEPALVLEAE